MGAKQHEPTDPRLNELYRGLDRLPADLWADLAVLDPGSVSRRAGVIYRAGEGYRLPFLNTDHWVDPERRLISVPRNAGPGAVRPGFQTGLVLLNYLIHAQEIGLSGRMVTARELNGGDLFFQGPHALSTRPVLDRFGRDAPGLVARGMSLGGTPLKAGLPAGDGAFRIMALPKILVSYTLYEADEEFEARLTVTFDAYTDRHLTLDGIWALVNVLSHRLARIP
ncbi:MAG: DUF3786 domain-containing protein [Thermodesulfobacteriota bacterium]